MKRLVLSAIVAATTNIHVGHAAQIETLKFNNWAGGAYTNDTTGGFSHCAVGSQFSNGTAMYFSVGLHGAVTIAFARQDWNFKKGEKIEGEIKIDDRYFAHVSGVVVLPTMITIAFVPTNPIFDQIKRGYNLLVTSPLGTASYNLKDSFRALDLAKQCVTRHAPAADVRVNVELQKWMARNPWFNNPTFSQQAQTAVAIDNQMLAEGKDNTKAEYYNEYDERLRQAGINAGGATYHAPPSVEPVRPSPKVPDAAVARPAPIGEGRRVALVIGNGLYRNVTRLDNPSNDANLLAVTLSALGFSLVGGGAQINLDKYAFDHAIRSFSNQIEGADVALFFYAGHGVQVRGSNYLVPVDANPTRDADVDFQMEDVNLVLRQMEVSGTKLNIVVLDACRNNPFLGRGVRTTSRGLAQVQAPEGTLISYATQPGNVAQDGNDGNSPYSKALAETIRRPGLDIFQMFNEVGLTVKRATGGAQQPWYSSSPIDGTYYFAGR